MDVAATEFHDNGKYTFEGASKTSAEMIAYYTSLVDAYPIVSIEDPLNEEDWAGWTDMTKSLGSRIQIVGDDLFVTNPERLARGIAGGTANALLVKVNQIGTLTETIDAVEMAHRANYRSMMSHRSGETVDRSRLVHLHVLSALLSTTNYYALKKSLLKAHVMPAEMLFHALRHK